MKKTVCILLVLLTCFTAAGCVSSSGPGPGYENQGKTVDDVLRERMSENTETASAAAPTVPTSKETSTGTKPADSGEIDIDVAALSATMVYSQVLNMKKSPDDYAGKRVRIKGRFAYTEGNGNYYFAVRVSDVTACCIVGIEFMPRDEGKFLEECPENGEDITIVGIFEAYTENDYRYCRLTDVVMG